MLVVVGSKPTFDPRISGLQLQADRNLVRDFTDLWPDEPNPAVGRSVGSEQ
jgi:hypothetical protein